MKIKFEVWGENVGDAVGMTFVHLRLAKGQEGLPIYANRSKEFASCEFALPFKSSEADKLKAGDAIEVDFPMFEAPAPKA